MGITQNQDTQRCWDNNGWLIEFTNCASATGGPGADIIYIKPVKTEGEVHEFKVHFKCLCTSLKDYVPSFIW